MTDYKQLCAELLEAWEIELGDLAAGNRLANRARAALAQPELEKLTRKTLIINPVQIVECGGPCFEDGPEACDCGALWRDEPMSQPEPQPTTGESSTVQPADWEVTELVDWLRDAAKEAASADCVTDAWWLTHAAELLERLSPPQPVDAEVAELVASLERMSIEADAAMQLSDSEVLGRAATILERLSPPQPIPVSERLPGSEDCDAEGRCWLCGKVEGDWRLLNPDKSGVPQLKYCFSHWLPAHALPAPSWTEQPGRRWR